MVNPFKKKKTEETFADGRVVVTNFSKLKKENYPQYEKGDMFFLHYDGKFFLDSEEEANEAVIIALKILVQYPKAELKKWEKEKKDGTQT